jgi:hypothetical protein
MTAGDEEGNEGKQPPEEEEVGVPASSVPPSPTSW